MVEAALAVLLMAANAAPMMQASKPSRSITLRDARTLPRGQLAERVLGEAGRLVAEVSRPPAERHPLSPPGLWSLVFAAVPRFSGIPGICEADTFFVHFKVRPGRPSEDDEAPALVTGLTTAKYYSVLDSAIPGSDDMETDEHRRRLDHQCAGTAPVLSQPEENARGSAFFSGTIAEGGFWARHAEFAARVLQEVKRTAPLVPQEQLRCSEDRALPNPQLCADPKSFLAALSLSDLDYISIAPCADDRLTLCVDATFQRLVNNAVDLPRQRKVTVKVKTSENRLDPARKPIGIRAVEIDGHTIVY